MGIHLERGKSLIVVLLLLQLLKKSCCRLFLMMVVRLVILSLMMKVIETLDVERTEIVCHVTLRFSPSLLLRGFRL